MNYKVKVINFKKNGYAKEPKKQHIGADYAHLTDRSLELWIRPNTRVSQAVLDAGWNIKKLW